MSYPSQTKDHLDREPTASTWFEAELEVVMPDFPCFAVHCQIIWGMAGGVEMRSDLQHLLLPF